VKKISIPLMLIALAFVWGCEESPTENTMASNEQEGPCPGEQDSVVYSTAPQILNFVTPPYPDECLQAGEGGIVGLNVLVGRLGGVQDVVVRNACAYHALNEAARTYAYENTYQPGQRGPASICMWMPYIVSFNPTDTAHTVTLIQN
jgi:outer membrane biosynthesis protein TonB